MKEQIYYKETRSTLKRKKHEDSILLFLKCRKKKSDCKILYLPICHLNLIEKIFLQDLPDKVQHLGPSLGKVLKQNRADPRRIIEDIQKLMYSNHFLIRIVI